MSYPYHMFLWDQRQARDTQRKIEQKRMEAVRPILEARAKAESKAAAMKQGRLF